MEFFVGDKVSLLHSTEDGVIVRIEGDIAHVLTGDGFEIPVMKNEIVLKDVQAERVSSVPGIEKETSSKTPHGVYLGILEGSGSGLTQLVLINTGVYDVSGIIKVVNSGSGEDLTCKVHSKLTCSSKSYLELPGFVNLTDNPPHVIIELNYHSKGSFKHKAPLYRDLPIKAKHFKTKRELPIIERAGYLISLDGTQGELKEIVPGEKITKAEKPILQIKPVRSDKELDLHIEALKGEHTVEDWEANAILDFQLAEARKALDEGALGTIHKLTLIHGVGNGVLKEELQKIISKLPQVDTFRDARRERFGYGALDVYFK